MSWSNETHQLLVSMSRHFYVAKHGVIRYQEKPMDVHMGNLQGLKKEHLVYYVLRDQFSGNFYFEVATTASFIPLLDFLYRGWKRENDEDHFYGLPIVLSVPKRISSPELLAGLEKLGVETFHPSSGFASGIRVLRDLEDNLCYYLLRRSAIHSLESIRLHKDSIYSYMLRRRYEDDRVKLWEKSLPPELLEDAPGYDTFTGFFPRPAKDKAGFRLFPDAEWEYAGNGRQLDFLVKPISETKYVEKKLHQAEDIIYEAWQSYDWPKRLYMAYEALRISPYCASAYNLLAARSEYLGEQLMLYQRGAQVAALALGELFFKKYRGHFWSMVESRPYMVSLQGAADCLWKKGQREEAIEIYREMLQLNPGDNQGIRYLLGFRLLETGQDSALEALFAEHDEECCFMLYNKVLWRYRTGAGDAAEILGRALKENRHVPAYLLGEEERELYSRPNSYSMGSVEEAVIYVQETKAAWRETPGALDWLQEIRAADIAPQPLQAGENQGRLAHR